jgi:hypothetical protein
MGVRKGASTSQTINFTAPSDAAPSDSPVTVSAAATSGLVVAFTSETLTVCTVAGNQVTLLTPGTCTITADQAGDATYAPAPPVTRSFQVGTTCATGDGAANTCVLWTAASGDTSKNIGPGGGRVFYVDPTAGTGSRYMEAAPATWSSSSGNDPELEWGTGTCSTSDIPGATGQEVGDGVTNTVAIIDSCPSPGQAPAAWATNNYTGGGVVWFLPSIDELKAFVNSEVVSSGFAYWSSTQATGSSPTCLTNPPQRLRSLRPKGATFRKQLRRKNY